jgi:deoxyribose-phosphate aldolase
MIEVSPDRIRQLVSVIDYSEALTIVATEGDVRTACAAGKRYGFRAVVAFPHNVGLMADELSDSNVRAQVAVGFPCGGHSTHVKCTEAEEGLKRGANDLDMVMNIGAFKSGQYDRVSQDIQAVREVAKPFGVPFKVIIEVGVLDDEEKVTAAKLVADAGADFVKTCTGFGPGRATIHDVMLIRRTIGDDVGIKASGGVASIEDGLALMDAGATVIAMRSMLLDQLNAIGFGA